MNHPARDARLYRLLLRLYPAEFRARYGRAMADFHRDRVAAARAGGESMLLLWLRTIADVVSSSIAEHAQLLPTGEPVLRTIAQDLGYAVRGLARRPGFTSIVVATIALGVGANAAIFSVVNGILLRPLPYPNPERVVSFGHAPPHWLASEPDFVDYRRELKSFDGLAAYTSADVTLTSGDEPERLRMTRASEDFFPVLGVRPLAGRTFALDEYAGNPPRVVMLSYALWQRRFAGDRSLVGKTIAIAGIPRTVVGIMPPHFDFPEARTDVWSPMPRLNPDSLNRRDTHFLFMVGRLKPGVSVEAVTTEAMGMARRFMREFPEMFDPKNPLTPKIGRVSDQLVGGTRPYLLALLGAVGFVLLIACANVANLLLVRGESRHREMALRSALGASGFRLLSQLLTESSVLALTGGALGLGLAWAGDRALIALAPPSIPRLDAIGIDWRVVVFTAGVAVGTGLLIGLLPAWRAARENAADSLKEGGKLMTGRASHGARRMLVVSEVALAVVTLAGAGMLLRSLWNLQAVDLGFIPGGAITARVSLGARAYDNARATIFFDQLLARIHAVPGVRAAGVVSWLPVVDAGGLWGFSPVGKSYPPGQGPSAVPQAMSVGALEALGLRLVAGRAFAETDRVGAPLVGIVSERLAQMIWPGENALGHRFSIGGNAPELTIVGVVRDIRARGFADTPEPTMYFPYAQAEKSQGGTQRAMTLVVRLDGDPLSFGQAIRDAVKGIDRTVPVSEVRTLDYVVGTSVSTRRFNTGLLAGFALLALLLAGIGTYGVISYGVSQRSFEIGVRMALGAEDRSVLMLVISEGMQLCAIGVAVGLVASVAVGQTIRAMLVGVPAVDVPTLGLTALLLVVVAGVASAVPARRALGVNPIDVLRGG